MGDSTTRLPMDPLGKALMGYDFDFEMCAVAMYKSDGAGGVELWDGVVDIDVTGNFYLNTDELESLLTSIKTAVELIDNAISGSEMQVDIVADGAGLATDSVLQDIRTAVQVIDNFISGSKGLVTEDNSAAIKAALQLYLPALQTEIQDTLGNYMIDDFDMSGDPVYIGYQRKNGNYYIKRYTLSTGAVDYTVGSSGYDTAWTNRATEDYNDFPTKF